MAVVGDALALADEDALGIQDPGVEQLGDRIDDAAAAEADGLLVRLADDAERRLHRLGIDDAGLDRAVRCAHAAGDVAALEGRACRAGARDHEVAVAEDDLAVRAEVDEQGQLVAVPEHAGERTGGDIAADIGADVRRKADGGVRMGGQAEVVHAQAVPVEEGGDIRLHADGIGLHADEQVVHRRVAGNAQAHDARGRQLGILTQGLHQRDERLLEDGVLQLLAAAGLALLDDTVDDVRAVADLAVAAGRLGQQAAVLHVKQHGGDRRGADVDADAAQREGVVLAGHVENGENTVLQLAEDAHGKGVVAQGLRQAAHSVPRQTDGVDAVLRLERAGQALVIGHGVVERRLLELKIDGAEAVAEADACTLDAREQLLEDTDLLAAGQVGRLHAAAVGRGDVRHEHHGVGRRVHAARQAPAVCILLVGDMGRLRAGQLAGDELHAALAARAVAGARRIDGDVGLARGVEHALLRGDRDHNGLFIVFKLEGQFKHDR